MVDPPPSLKGEGSIMVDPPSLKGRGALLFDPPPSSFDNG